MAIILQFAVVLPPSRDRSYYIPFFCFENCCADLRWWSPGLPGREDKEFRSAVNMHCPYSKLSSLSLEPGEYVVQVRLEFITEIIWGCFGGFTGNHRAFSHDFRGLFSVVCVQVEGYSNYEGAYTLKMLCESSCV